MDRQLKKVVTENDLLVIMLDVGMRVRKMITYKARIPGTKMVCKVSRAFPSCALPV